MNNPNDPIDDDQFEAYLDGTLSSAEREELAKKLQHDAGRQAEAALQANIDHALRKSFPVVHATQVPADTLLNEEDAFPQQANTVWQTRLLAACAVAAVLFGVLLTWWVGRGASPQPFFRPTPLAQIYRATLQSGFRPYYECHDDQRFADIFAARQGIPMHLLPMPEGTQMLGLSYPGGLSRETTAMLCTVDETPVMVFVDRAEADNEIAAHVDPGEPPVHVFREARDGLVLYEVSSLNEPRAMKFLAIGMPSPSATN